MSHEDGLTSGCRALADCDRGPRILFGVAVCLVGREPANQGSELGTSSSWPEALSASPTVHRPQLGTAESLESHSSADWVDSELRGKMRRHRWRHRGD
jgi:hypothetical protein